MDRIRRKTTNDSSFPPRPFSPFRSRKATVRRDIQSTHPPLQRRPTTMTSRSIPSSPPTSPPRRASRSRTATQRNFELVIDLPPSPSRKRSPSTSPLSKNHHTAKKLRRGRDEDASLSTGKENIDPVAVEEDSTRVGEMDLDIDSIKLGQSRSFSRFNATHTDSAYVRQRKHHYQRRERPQRRNVPHHQFPLLPSSRLPFHPE